MPAVLVIAAGLLLLTGHAAKIVLQVLTLLLAGVIVIVLMLIGAAAFAHQAPSGWHYDTDCCNTRDCGPAPVGAVTEVRKDNVLGYAIRLRAGEHHHFPGALDAFVPADSPKVRRSGDADYHACVSVTGEVLCLYAPLGGS